MQARRKNLDAGDHVVDRGKLLGRVTAAFVAADEVHGDAGDPRHLLRVVPGAARDGERRQPLCVPKTLSELMP